MNPIVKLVANGRWVIRSHYMNAKIALILNTAYYKSVKGLIGVIDYDGSLRSILERVELRGNPENIILLENYPEDINLENLFIVEPRRIPLNLSYRNILITLTPGTGVKAPRIFRKAYITRYDDEYVFRTGYEEYRFRLRGLEIVSREKPEGLLGKAYELLRESIMEYGELSVGDAVFILTRELGVSREKARWIISELTRRKYIGVRRGLIEVW